MKTVQVDMIVDFLVVFLRHVPTIRTVQNTVEVSESQYLDRVVDVLGVVQRQVPRFPRRTLSGSAAGAV